jgi:NifB/MoaA-like Fe-S oxidoreductase
MEEILKQILNEIQGLKENQAKTDQKIDILNERIELHDKSNKEEFKQISKKLDGITEVVAQTMENVTELKDKVEKQDIEIRVIKGGR